ncbi:transposase [Francisella noatunensis]
MYFTGFTPTDNLPDYSTINKFQNLLIEKRKLKKLFKLLNSQLEDLGLYYLITPKALLSILLLLNLQVNLISILIIYQMIEKNLILKLQIYLIVKILMLDG